MNKITTSLADCPAGATLAEDIVNENGVIVLKAGTLLTEAKINGLQKYELDNIVISSTDKLTEAERAEKRERIEKNIDKRMRKCEMTVEMSKFRNVLLAYYCRGLG